MAFSFGSSGQTAFGSTPRPTGFGTPFGATSSTTTTTTASSGFGFGSSFGANQPAPAFGAQQQTPAFGSTTTPAFGAQATPAFGGSTFGSTAATTTPGFGTSFGTTTTSAPSFGTSFGATTGGGLFGAQTTKPSLFGTPATTSSLFSGASATPSLFGTATTTQAPSLFGNVQTSTTPSLFGTTTSTTPSLFGSSFGAATTTTPSLFGTTTSTTPGFGLFGSSTTTTSAPSLFGGFGTTQQTNTGFGGFGTGTGTTGAFGGFGTGGTTGTTSLFGQPQQQNQITQQQQHQLEHERFLVSIYNINIFNDERDDILKKWNMLQACWGVGKGYYSQNAPPVEYTPYNPFYRFRAVSYNVIPQHDNAEGIVKLIFNKKYSDLSSQKQALINGFTGILGNKPNLKVIIHNIKALSDNQAEVRIVITEKGVTGTTRKIPATELAAYLNQPTQKQQLTNVGVTSIVAFVTPSKAALDEYLRNAPQGFDAQMWKAAVADNPNPKKYMPVPIYGFNDLKARKLKQEHETGLHRAYKEKINKELEELKKKHAASIARINEFRHRLLQLQHRTLRILVRQESIRKAGLAVQPEEEYLRGKLETMYSQLNIPTQFKGQLNELISTVKLMECTKKPIQPQYKIVPDSQVELKEFLTLQQNGIAKLVDIVKEDNKALNIISEAMKDRAQSSN